jgi:hypothetical protein
MTKPKSRRGLGLAVFTIVMVTVLTGLGSITTDLDGMKSIRVSAS